VGAARRTAGDRHSLLSRRSASSPKLERAMNDLEDEREIMMYCATRPGTPSTTPTGSTSP
jgi:hypothetical protein